MPRDLPTHHQDSKTHLPIGEAAAFLGVSVDTLRRWDKAGKVTAVRLDGKNRYFSVDELETVKGGKKLKVSEAAEMLGVSATTLRRLESQGAITSGRGKAGERLFTPEEVGRYVAHGASQAVVEPQASEARLERLERLVEQQAASVAPEPIIPQDRAMEPEDKVITLSINTNKMRREAAERLRDLGRDLPRLLFGEVGLVWATLWLVMIVGLSSLMPKAGQSEMVVQIFHQGQSQGQVLAASDSQGLWGRVTGFFRSAFEGPISIVNKVDNFNDVFEYNEQGQIILKDIVIVPSSTIQTVKETQAVTNVNAETVQSREPGVNGGDLVYWTSVGKIGSLVVPVGELAGGAVSGGIGGVITDGSIVSADLAGDSVGSDKIADGAVTSAKMAAGAVSEGNLADGVVTGLKVADGALSANDFSGDLVFAAGDLIDLSKVVHDGADLQGLRLPNTGASPTAPSSGEGYLAYDTVNDAVKVFDGTSWAEIGGSITLTTSSDSTNTSSNSGLELSGGELAMLRGCATGELLKWDDTTKLWACASDSGAGGAGISTIEHGNASSVTSATNIDFLAADFVVTPDGVGEGDISIDYTNSKIVRSDQAEIISAGWTFDGGITANDASADTILIGQNGTTDDTVTIAGNTSITDDQWSISATGVTSGLSGVTADGVAFSGVSAATNTGALVIGTGGSLATSGSGTITATDLSCTNCIGATEVDESTIASTGLSDTANIGYLNQAETVTSAWEFSGGVTMNDASADTILIGQSGATDDTVTIAGNVSITDDDWGISATGVGTGLTATDLSCTDCIGPTEITDLTLGTDTAGNYVAGNTGGNGIAVSGSAAEGWSPGLAVDTLGVADGVGATSSFSGMEFGGAGSDKLALLQGCTDNEILKYTDAAGWACAADGGGGGGGSLDDAYNSAAATVIVDAYDVVFELNDATNDYNFVVDNTTTGAIATAFAVTTTGAGGTFATAIDVSDAEIGTAISFGANDITGTSFTVTGSSGNVDTAGTIQAGSANVTLTDASGNLIHDSLVDCASENYILKWTSGGGWACAADASGGGGGNRDDAYNNGGTITVDAYDVLFSLNNATSDYKLTLDNSTTGEITTSMAVTTTGVGGTIVTAVDLSDGGITNALSIGTSNIVTGATTLASTELDILDGGILLSELTDTGTLTAGTVDIGAGNIDGTAIGVTAQSSGAFTTLSSTGTVNLSVDTDADTITIGQSGATDDVVVIAGNTSITDDQWSISAAGAGSLVSLNVNSGGLTNTGSVAGATTVSVSTSVTSPTYTGTGAVAVSSGGSSGLSFDSASGTVSIAAGDVLSNGTWSISSAGVGTALTATDLSCADCIGGTEIAALTLGTDTTGNYVADVTGGNGLVATGTPAAGWTPSVAIDLLGVSDGAGLTSSFSGMEMSGASSDKLALLQGCTDNEILKYTDAGGWACAADGGGGGGAWSDLTAPAGALTLAHGVNVTTMGWTATGALDGWINNFNNNAGSATTQRAVSIVNTVTAQTVDVNTEALLLLDNADTSVAGSTVVDDALLITVSGTLANGIVDGVDASDANITNAINIGANAIAGTNFSVTGAGAVTAVGVDSGSGLLQGTGGVTTTGSVNINNNASTNTTNIATGSTTGAVAIGGGSNTLAIATTSWDVTTAGAFSGLTTLGLSGAITGATGVSTTTVTASSAIAANGGITFDASTDTLGAFTAAGTVNLNTNLLTDIGNAGTDFAADGGLTLANAFTVTTGGASITGALTSVTTMSSSGDWTWTATTPSITVNNGEVFTVTDASTPDTFTLDTTGSSMAFSDGTNSFTFDVDTGPVYAGTAMPTREETLSPEFAGATLEPDTTSNIGTMTSAFCSNTVGGVPDTNTGVCNTSADIHNYYNWTTGEGSVQDYDIYIRWRVPDNFSSTGFSGVTNPIKVYGKRTDATNNAVTVYVYDTAGVLENSGGTQVAGTTWTQTSVEATFAGTYTAGSYMTIRIVVAADTGGDSVQVGEISLDYLSNN